ncbi:hypothetical protein D3Z50_11695 [Clostridiaceae bacterium]|nr:hypothetical protein [Clostridiaceae bacterium]
MAGENVEILENSVVNKAKVRCSYSQNSTRLQVEKKADGSGVKGWYITATEQDCKAGVNLLPYKRCYSPYLVETVDMLYGKTSDKHNEFQAKRMEYGYADCIHLLEEIWFDAKEKDVVDTMYNMEERLIGNQENLVGDVLRIRPRIIALNQGIKPLLKEEKGTGYYYDSFLDGRNRQRNRILTEIIGAINDNLDHMEKGATPFGYAEEDSLSSSEFLRNYESMWKVVSDAHRNIQSLAKEKTWDIGSINRDIKPYAPSEALNVEAKNPERTGKMIANDIEELESYNVAFKLINKLEQDLWEIITKIKDWTTDYSGTLTTDSFMVCRCGGMLTFETSGQEWGTYFSNLYIRTLELVCAVKERYAAMEKVEPVFKYQDDKYQLKYAYANAVAGLEKTETFLTEGTTDSGTMGCNVHLEFVAKSVSDQMGMYLSALISIVGLIPGTTGVVAGAISGLMAVYNVVGKKLAQYSSNGNNEVDYEIKEILQDSGSIAGGLAGVITKGYQDAGLKIPPKIETGLKVASGFSNVMTMFSLMEVVNYEITDNWVKSIRVYIFTEEYLFFVEQFLDEKCKKKGEPRFSMVVERKYYIHERRGSNIKWGENPGITYNGVTNVGQEAERTKAGENLETTSSDMNNVGKEEEKESTVAEENSGITNDAVNDTDAEEKGANDIMFENLMNSGMYN